MQKLEGRQRIRGGDLNATTLRKGYSISTKSHFEEVHNQFEEFMKRTYGSLFQTEAQTRKDLLGDTSHKSLFAAIGICFGIDCF